MDENKGIKFSHDDESKNTEAQEFLITSESSALENNQIISHVVGKNIKKKGVGGKIKAFGAMGFLTAMLIVFAVLFSSGNLIPSAISERLIEETDVQYADAVESKKLVFQQAMKNGDLPENTVAILEQNGVKTETAENGEIVLIINNKTITADNFIEAVSSDVALYNAFNNATYSRAAYYYDDSAYAVFEKIGTTRNNYTKDSDFDNVMESLVGNGSSVSVNNVSAEEDKDGNVKYAETGETAHSSQGAEDFINGVSTVNVAGSTAEATLNSADAIKVADTTSKEQRSSLFYVTFMENISKMKAGEGDESKINEALNYLYKSEETEVVDVKTGEVTTVTGTALDSPSLYAILSGTKVNAEAVENYSSERVLKTVENQLGVSAASSSVKGTVASTSSEIKGSVGRFLNIGGSESSTEILSTVNKTVDKSLINNSYDSIKGVDAGEMLVEGAVNVGKELAKASGATAGDTAAVESYARMTSGILAMDAAADRMNRSPFDVTSKNTFLGSIFYNLAVASIKVNQNATNNNVILSGIKSLASVTNTAVKNVFAPSTYADETETYLTEQGSCETYESIGAVGEAHCAMVATFDTSTLNDTFNDTEFQKFVEENTTLNSSGKRTINSDSILADFIQYNDERSTPLGVNDGGILNSLNNNASKISFVSDIIGMIKEFLGASDYDKNVASGAEYVNSSSNQNWEKYKYAQRYVSLARATESLRQYSGDSTAYSNIYGFEGTENPVVAFKRDLCQTAQR